MNYNDGSYPKIFDSVAEQLKGEKMSTYIVKNSSGFVIQEVDAADLDAAIVEAISMHGQNVTVEEKQEHGHKEA